MKQLYNRLKKKRILFLLVMTGLCIIIHQSPIYSQEPTPKQEKKSAVPKIISFYPDSIHYQNLFNGEKDSVVFYSGVVTLQPNKSGSIHNTEIYEEMIITLEGEGQLKIKDRKPLDLKFGKIALVPPHTEHQTTNNGEKNFKYIYIAVESREY